LHLAIETITKGLVEAGCSSVQDPTAATVMKDLGGYTQLLSRCIDGILERFSENPRAEHMREAVLRSLRAQMPALRTQTQTFMGRLRLSDRHHAQMRRPGSRARGPLPPGAYPEIELRAARIRWKGRADLLFLSETACEILDFKTGDEDPSAHEFQLRVYALLWSRDSDLNPTGRRSNALTLAYRHKDISVPPPSDEELAALERHL